MDFLFVLCSLLIQAHKYRLLQERYLILYDDDDDDYDILPVIVEAMYIK